MSTIRRIGACVLLIIVGVALGNLVPKTVSAQKAVSIPKAYGNCNIPTGHSYTVGCVDNEGTIRVISLVDGSVERIVKRD